MSSLLIGVVVDGVGGAGVVEAEMKKKLYFFYINILIVTNIFFSFAKRRYIIEYKIFDNLETRKREILVL